MNRRSYLALFAVSALALMSVLSVGYAATSFSTLSQFNVTQNHIALNISNGFNQSLIIGGPFGNASGVLVYLSVGNLTSSISNTYLQDTFSNPTCGSDGSFDLAVQNASGTFSNLTTASGSQFTNASIMLSTPQLVCNPGRYFGYLNFSNVTNVDEYANISVVIDIPITSSSNSFNNSNSGGYGSGFFNGSVRANVPVVNATASQRFHSYFFNTSVYGNISGFVINVSTSTLADAFVLDSAGNLVAKDISGGATKSLVAGFPNGGVYEIRLFANDTANVAYNGQIKFSTLNLTNVSGAEFQNSFGSFRLGNMRSGNITSWPLVSVSNGGDVQYDNVVQTSGVNYIKSFAAANSSGDFKFLVPRTASRIRVSVNWTAVSGINVTNYTLMLTSPNGTLVGQSVNNYIQANMSNVEREEFIETTGVAEGLWNISVRNGSTSFTIPANNNYTAIARVYFNSSRWVATNFSSYANASLAAASTGNFSARNIALNFTVPNDTLDGSYEGFIDYTAVPNGTTTRSIFAVTVETGTLMVNQTVNSTSVNITHNFGIPLNTSISLSMNNTGSLDLAFDNYTLVNSSSRLSLAGNASSFINFSVLAGNGVLSARENRTINVTFNISNSDNGGLPGIYSGWAFFESGNSHPAQGFNLSLNMNLTNAISVRVNRVIFGNTSAAGLNQTFQGAYVNNTVANTNVTLEVQVAYANGTLIEDVAGDVFGTSNFSAFMVHQNLTQFRVPSSGDLQYVSGLDSYETSGKLLNLTTTVFNNTQGGYYNFVANLVLNSSGGLAYAGGVTQTNFYVNNASVQMSTNVSGCSFGTTPCNSSTVSLNNVSNPQFTASVLLTNLGVQTASSVSMNIQEACTGWTPTSLTTNCTGATGSTNTVSSISIAAGGTCLINWNITAHNATSACIGFVGGTPVESFFYAGGVSITVDPDDAGSSDSGSSGSSGSSSSGSSAAAATTTTTTTSSSSSNPRYIDISKWKSIVEVGQGKTGTATVTVSNVNDTLDQDVSVNVIDLGGGITSSVSPASVKISTGDSSDFTVTFSVPEGTAVDDYAGKFQAVATKATVTQDFALNVLPGEAAKVAINTTFMNLTKELLLFWSSVNSSRASGVNVSSTDSLVVQVRSKLAEAEAQLALGTDQGFFQANEIMKEVANLLDTAKAQLKVDRQNGGGFILPIDPLYIGIGVGVAAIGFLVYLFLPTKSGPNIKIGGMGKHVDKVAGAAGKVGDAAGTVAGKTVDVASAAKDAAAEQVDKIKEKLSLKKTFKYKYEE